MSRDGVDRRRNIFDAFLSFVKIEKDEECRPCSKSIKRVSESSRDGFSPTPSSTSSLGDLWIKPESDLIQDPALLQPPAVARDKPTLPEPPIPPFDTNCSDPTLSGPDLESRISSPLPALCISSVTNISHPYVPPVDKCNIASVDTQSTLAPIIPTPTVADDSTCRVECLSPAPEVQPDSLSAPHDNTSSWSFSFGCLDDLLSQGDPCRSTYIQYKCTKLRYPLPLAAAMAKLYGPSKIPVLTSDPQCDSNTPAVETFLSKSRSRDQGFLEIDDSHFTVSNGSTSVPSSVSFTVTNHTVPKPLTKAQLRHAQTRRETRQSHSDMIVSPTTMEVTDKCSRRESTAVPRSERTNPGDRRRRFSIANKRRSTGLLITSKPLSVVVQSEQAKISSSLGAQPCKSPNSVVICTPSPNLTPENPTLGPPQCNESCADSPNIVKNSRMSSPRSLDMHSWYSHFKLSRNRHSRQRLKPVVAKVSCLFLVIASYLTSVSGFNLPNCPCRARFFKGPQNPN
ncbi:hypothetical protein D915_003753 [Fasciola hepatica]|uniref:Uncharacterized protein n=1 Tax=Fasciola hepatica TaxID=6192 RepID=A0A4E0S221_FASHE|nr:hypothetical protein D915_003753 [Fasciola hepatica]